MNGQAERNIGRGHIHRPGDRKPSGGARVLFAVGVGLSALLVGCGAPSTASSASSAGEVSEALTFTAWGGTTQEAAQKAWTDPYAAETGLTVTQAGPTDYGKLQTMVEAGDPSWSVVDVEGYFVPKAAELGLLEKLDYTIIPESEIFPEWVHPYGVGDFAYSFVISYRTDTNDGKHPTDWAGFFDTETYPGKRGFYKYAYSGIFEAALLADGVPADQLYPLDFDRAFAKLDTIKDDIVWWNTGAESQLQLQNGTVAYSSMWNGRVYSLISEGVPVEMEWNQNLQAADYLVIPKGASPKGNDLIAYALSAEPQAEFADLTSLAPVNKGAVDMVDEKVRPYLSTTPEHREQGIAIDDVFWSTAIDDVQERWQSWLVG
jgi:putative spermidine/putrescine transport system substrate-binding protein